MAETSGVELASIEVDGLGHVERGADARFQFVAIELTLEVEAEGEHPHTVQRLVEDAKRLCVVSAAPSTCRFTSGSRSPPRPASP